MVIEKTCIIFRCELTQNMFSIWFVDMSKKLDKLHRSHFMWTLSIGVDIFFYVKKTIREKVKKMYK